MHSELKRKPRRRQRSRAYGAEGEFACTVQMVDVATGRSERVAVPGRSYSSIFHLT